MTHSRRAVLASAVRLAALGLVPAAAARAAELAFAENPFTLGVASGYPDPNAVVLWTRLAPEPLAPDGGMPAAAIPVDWEIADDDAFRRVRRAGRTYATPEWAHTVHVEAAGLDPGRDYWYRFTSGGARSPAGRTRTAPAPSAAPERLRLAVASCQHYESGRYAAYRAIASDAMDLVVHVGDYIYENRGFERVRAHDEPEAYTLDDYRRRYTIYKLDPDLQAAHASCPWLATSDDHEVDNDYAAGTSEEDDASELFLARRAAAYRAYYEHLPMPRRLVPFGAHQRLHTRRGFGNLVSLVMLDGRQYRDVHACGKRLVAPCAALYDAERSMLGQAQERWLEETLAASGARWNLLAQQTVFANLDQSEGEEVGYWSDAWSGYPAARERLTRFLAERRIANPVILSGDVHSFLVNDVRTTPGEPESPLAAAELVTTSISSPGPTQATLDVWAAENANVRLARGEVRGYLRLDVQPESLHADLVGVDDVARADSRVRTIASFDVEDGRPGVAR